MHFVFAFLVAAVAAVLTACAPVHPSTDSERAGRGIPEVILVSIDGYRADYFARGDNPILQSLAASGVRARWLIPSFPTVTEPNHYTLLTGLYPDHHGIVGNDIADPQVQSKHFYISRYSSTENPRWWSEATPLWVSLQRNGMRTGEVSWPSGEVRIEGMRPDLLRNGEQAGPPFQATATVLRWLGLPATQRPHLILLHYDSVDYEGHHHGPDSPQLDAALRKVDEAIGHLVKGLKRDGLYTSTDLVIVSDHGMAAVPPDHEIYLDNIIDPDAVNIITLGAMAGVDPRQGLAGRDAVMALLAPHLHMRCWRKQELPPRLHYGRNPRVPQIVCLASPGWIVTTDWAMAHSKYVLRGIHGYDNSAPSMRALFIAEGPSFRHGVVVPPFPNVDVYPLLAHIFRVRPEPNDGDFAQVAPLLAHWSSRH